MTKRKIASVISKSTQYRCKNLDIESLLSCLRVSARDVVNVEVKHGLYLLIYLNSRLCRKVNPVCFSVMEFLL